MKKGKLLYSGKAKSVYETENPQQLVIEFRNDTSAFDGKKVAQLDRKGMVNNKFNAFIMDKLSKAGIETHFEQLLSDTESLVKRMAMLPVECVVRNRAAGSLVRKLGIEEGRELNPAVFEFFYKSDALGDPMINDSHIITFGWATAKQIEQMKTITHQVNEVLSKLFLDGGLILVDYKLEFGVYEGRVLLGDEFSPDGCRLWDASTMEKMDKDRFRQDLGNVIEAYEEVGRRIGVSF
ncbi:phosphoribosylaminoimidazolesuccinocarboxamide synthase [Gynuella sunshinyii]|uniref:Phosphoribosylaminoimidazole-succinocarboxamide synthase n=1 Tax=Gynuella sunshinyii YC6258 TaxID=1445510 RepID=A0A0C5VVZ4_9GAMM|nr:phosphoribosylaminoimidazolesuccinocarboxamide synthase [Gynuella sunshinyii]AJQ94634.1 phosphoribosylaminoimidazolesuccinocarboxamide (SAICAR) synthase [Gynuella sunshinyii YC6258]